MKKEFLVAFRAGEPAGPRAQDLQACAAGRFGNAFNSALVQFGIAHDPAFADIAAIEFELGFHQNEEFGAQRGEPRHSGQHLGNGNEGQIDGDQVRFLCKSAPVISRAFRWMSNTRGSCCSRQAICSGVTSTA